jgi:CHAD domain-containing protein
MDSQGVEVEKKYDVGADAEVPALAELPGVARVGEPRVDTLEAVYFDTRAHTLASRSITLRRRTGGADAGWHLKLPSQGPGAEPPGQRAEPQRRRELHAPRGQPAVVPDSLLAYLWVYLRGEKTMPVVRLRTQRTTYPLYGEDGAHLADLADDCVTAEVPGAGGGPGRTQEWREWELELVHGSPELFPAAEELLAAAGALPAQHQSKLAKALGESGAGESGAGASIPRPKPGAAPDAPPPGKKGPAADLLTAYLAAQVREILVHDPGVRLEEPEAVHDLRSATRRARSALEAYRRFYNALAIRHLAAELKWLGRVLGVPRDADVMLDRLRTHAAALPAGSASVAVKDRLEDELGVSRDAAHRKLQMAMVSARYFDLLDALEAFLGNPPVRQGGAEPAGEAAGKQVAKAAKRLRRSDKAARRARRGAEHETSLHTVRKDAKRLRHVAESAEPVLGKRAAKIAKAAHSLQQILGDFHDSVVARDLLVKLLAAPELPEAVASAYVTLHTQQVQLAAEAEAHYLKERKKSRNLLQRRVT